MKLADYRKISPALYADLKVVFEKHGFAPNGPRALVDERLGTVKLTYELATSAAAADPAKNPDALYYVEWCRQMGSLTELKAEWLNETFVSGGVTYRLAGRKRKGKNNMLIERLSDHTMRVTTEEQIALQFNAKAARAKVA